MFGFIKQRLRRKFLKTNTARGKVSVVKPSQIGLAAFVFNVEKASDIASVEQIAAFAKKQNFELRGLVVQTGKCFRNNAMKTGFVEDVCNPAGFVFIEKNMLNWLGVPSHSELGTFFDTKYDLFISLNNSDNFTLNYLSLKVDAACHIGMMNNEKMPYDIVFEYNGKEEVNYGEYLNRILGYLSDMNRDYE